jgi:hypothetical protein
MRRPRLLAATLTDALVHRSAFTGGNLALARNAKAFDFFEATRPLGRSTYESFRR